MCVVVYKWVSFFREINSDMKQLQAFQSRLSEDDKYL